MRPQCACTVLQVISKGAWKARAKHFSRDGIRQPQALNCVMHVHLRSRIQEWKLWNKHGCGARYALQWQLC